MHTTCMPFANVTVQKQAFSMHTIGFSSISACVKLHYTPLWPNFAWLHSKNVQALSAFAGALCMLHEEAVAALLGGKCQNM